MTARVNSSTVSPRWFWAVVSTVTMPRSGWERDSRMSVTSVRALSVSPWKTGAVWRRSVVARLAIALPLTVGTVIPKTRE